MVAAVVDTAVEDQVVAAVVVDTAEEEEEKEVEEERAKVAKATELLTSLDLNNGNHK